MNVTAVLPLFPLSTVLFPGGPLPLRIFEARYIDMVSRCMRQRSPFGVVLIREGAEVGEVLETAEVGTTASIVDFGTMPDGLLGITCVGERKFRLRKRWRQDDGLNMAEIEYLPAEPTLELPADCLHLGELLQQVLPDLGEAYVNIPRHLDDASWVGYRLAEILPISLAEKLALLEINDPIARLSRVAPLIRLKP